MPAADAGSTAPAQDAPASASGRPGAAPSLASLLVLSPDGSIVPVAGADESGALVLRGVAVRVGRDPDNEVVLGPDPEQLVSRQHCVIEGVGRHWRIRDLDSVNHVFVERAGERARVDSAELLDGDQICLRADGPDTAEDDVRFWRLVFNDRGQTRRAGSDVWLQYYAASRTVWILGGLPRSVKPRAKAMRVLLFMLERHRDAGDPAEGVVFSHDDLKRVAWPEDHDPTARSNAALASLMFELRQDLGGSDALLRTEIGHGYRLVPRP